MIRVFVNRTKMSRVVLLHYLFYLFINVITATQNGEDVFNEDKATSDRISEGLKEGFTTKDGVEIPNMNHWVHEPSEEDSPKELLPGDVVDSIHGWTFTKEFSIPKTFPMDPEARNFVRRRVKNALYSYVNCTPFKTPVSIDF